MPSAINLPGREAEEGQPGPAPNFSAELLRDLARRYEQAYNEHDIEGFLACHTEDAVWETPLFYPDGTARGHDAIRCECERAWRALPDQRFNTEELFISLDGRRAAQWWTGHGTLTGRVDPPGYRATNQPLDLTGVSVWELRDGRLSHVREYFDAMAAGRQVGLVPAPGSLGERTGLLLQWAAARRMRAKKPGR